MPMLKPSPVGWKTVVSGESPFHGSNQWYRYHKLHNTLKNRHTGTHAYVRTHALTHTDTLTPSTDRRGMDLFVRCGTVGIVGGQRRHW